MGIGYTHEEVKQSQTEAQLALNIAQLNRRILALGQEFEHECEKLATTRFGEDAANINTFVQESIAFIRASGTEQNSYGAYERTDKQKHLSDLEMLWDECQSVRKIIQDLTDAV